MHKTNTFIYDYVIHICEVIIMNKDQIKIGMTVDYHEIIGGPVTTPRCKVQSEPWQLGSGTWVVKISGVRGGVDLAAITPSQ